MKNRTIISILITMLLVFTSTPITAIADDIYSDKWADGTFSSLDTGIYWYSENSDLPIKAGATGANYDETKPTIIYCHGNKLEEGYNRREVLTLYQKTNGNFKSAGYEPYEFNENEAQYYLDLGYNVGSFYWNQLSDDDLDCDVKIWSSTDKEHKMRYATEKDGKRTVVNKNSPTESVSVMLGNAIINDLGENFSGTLQLAGHSMGAQLVIATSQYLVLQGEKDQTKAKFVPQRVTLIDPYFGGTLVNSKIDATGENGNGKTVSELSADAMEYCANKGIAYEAYGANVKYINRLYSVKMALSSDTAKANEITKKLTDNCAWVYLDALQTTYTTSKSHCMVIDYYFSTVKESAKTDNFNNPVPYALMDTETLKTLKGNGYSQRAGNGNTFYMHTANFVRVNSDLTDISSSTATGAIYFSLDSANENYKIDLTSPNGTVTSTNLNSNGEIKFSNLSSGKYTLKVFDEADSEINLEQSSVTLSDNHDIESLNGLVKESIIGSSSGITSIIDSNPVYIGIAAVALVAIVVLIIVIVKKKK